MRRFDMLLLQQRLSDMFERLSDEGLKNNDLQEELSRAIGLNELAKSIIANNLAIIKAAELCGAPIGGLNLIPVENDVTPPALTDGKRKSLLNRPKTDMR